MGLLRLLGIEKYLKKVKTYVDEKTANIPLSSLSDEVKDKLVGVEKHNRLEWEYVDADDACFAKSKTNKIIVGGVEYSLNEDDIVDVIIDGVNFGLAYTSDNRIRAYGGNEENIDILANNVFALDDGTIEEKYIPETIARKEYVDDRFGELESNGMKYILSPFVINEGTKSLPNDMLRFFGTPLIDMTCIEISDSLSAIIRVKPTFIEDALDDAYYLVCNVKFNGQEYSKTYKVSRNGNIELI